jgi:hypothetical protein
LSKRTKAAKTGYFIPAKELFEDMERHFDSGDVQVAKGRRRGIMTLVAYGSFTFLPFQCDLGSVLVHYCKDFLCIHRK